MKSFLLFLTVLFVAASARAETAHDAAAKIVGTYRGEWKMFGRDAAGLIVEKSAWSDELIAANLTDLKDRAYVEVEDTMTFADGTKRVSKFHEGFFANADGSAGDRFYEIAGDIVIFKKLDPNNWSFLTAPSSGELSWMGFALGEVLGATNVTIKSTTYEGAIDTDNVSRITTVQLKDASGAIRVLQFTSMQGYHNRM